MNLAIQTKLNDAVHALLALSAVAHQWHLNTRSYAQHMALGELYTYAHDAADGLAEKAIGANYSPIATSNMTVSFTAPERAVPDTEKVIAVIQKLSEESKKAEVDWLANESQGIQGALYGILYKLKRLS